MAGEGAVAVQRVGGGEGRVIGWEDRIGSYHEEIGTYEYYPIIWSEDLVRVSFPWEAQYWPRLDR